MNVPSVPDTVQLIPLDQVVVPPDRLREVDADRAEQLAVSMRKLGQLTPIEVSSPGADGRYVLTMGAHRLDAAKRAQLPAIRAIVFDGDAMTRRLREIDENLYRHELNPLDQAAFLAERRKIYEGLSGPVTRGRPSRENIPSSGQLSFFDDTTAKFGISRKIIEKALSRYWALQSVFPALRGTPVAKSGAQMDALAKLPAAELTRVVDAVTGRGISLRAAMADLSPPDDEGLRRIKRAQRSYLRLTADERRSFMSWARKEGVMP